MYSWTFQPRWPALVHESKKRAAKDSLSLLQYGSAIAGQAVLAPIVLKVAGRETLGAYAAVMQAVAYLALVDMGFSMALERYLGQSFGLEDGGKRFRDLFTTARTFFLLSNIAFAALVVLFSFYVARFFSLSPAVAIQARHALYVVALWAVVRTPLAAYNTASIATQDLAATNIIGAGVNALGSVVSLVFVLAGFGLFGLMVSSSVSQAVGSVVFRMRFRKLNPHRMPRWGLPDRALFREMLGFGSQAMFVNVGCMLVYTSGNVLAGYVAGAAATSVFYTTQMPTMIGTTWCCGFPTTPCPQ